MNDDNITTNTNINDYYKNLYQKTKKENIILLTKIKDLQQRDINNEKIIMQFKIERKNFIKKIKEFETIIKEHGGVNAEKILNSKNEKLKYNLETEGNNNIIMENEILKKRLNKILFDNNELKIKIKSFEKLKLDNPKKNNININKNYNRINNLIHPLIRNKSFIQQNSAINRSFRVINNISLFNNNTTLKEISKQLNNNTNNTNDEISTERTKNFKINNTNNIQRLKKENIILRRKIGESKNKDSYINDLEEEQKQNRLTIKKIIKVNNNLLDKINILKKELNNRMKEIIELHDKTEKKDNIIISKNEYEKIEDLKEKYNSLLQEIIKLKKEIKI